MANRLNRKSVDNITEKVDQMAELANAAKTEKHGSKTKEAAKKIVSIRISESDRNKIAGTFQLAAGVNFTDALTQSALFVCRLYEQGKINITKNGILYK